MPEGAITLSVEKISIYSKLIALLPVILKALIIVVFLVLIYFLYKLLKKKRIEKELIRAAQQMPKKIFKRKKRKKKPRIEVVELPQEEIREGARFELPADIEKHLKENEKIIINILKQRNGQAEQGTLRVISGFPKASLSRILKELEERKVVYKEKRGKKNIVFLKK